MAISRFQVTEQDSAKAKDGTFLIKLFSDIFPLFIYERNVFLPYGFILLVRLYAVHNSQNDSSPMPTLSEKTLGTTSIWAAKFLFFSR